MNEELSFEVLPYCLNTPLFSCGTLRLCAVASTDMLDLGGDASFRLCLGVSKIIFSTECSSRADCRALKSMSFCWALFGFTCRHSQSCMCGDVKSEFLPRTSSWSTQKACVCSQVGGVHTVNPLVLSVRRHASLPQGSEHMSGLASVHVSPAGCDTSCDLLSALLN